MEIKKREVVFCVLIVLMTLLFGLIASYTYQYDFYANSMMMEHLPPRIRR